MKACSTCKKEKELSEFNKSKRYPDGHACQCKNCRKEYRERNKDFIRANYKIWFQENKGYMTIAHKKWRENNLAKHNANSARYRASKLLATPKWLTREHLKEIEQFYIQAENLTKSTKVKYTVDHIMPLQGKDICGLHVPWNLQVITQIENTRKLNRI